jgi:hypothetical protein
VTLAQGVTVATAAAQLDNGTLHIGALAFIQRLDSSLNAHVHFLVWVVDGLFQAVAGAAAAVLCRSGLWLVTV